MKTIKQENGYHLVENTAHSQLPENKFGVMKNGIYILENKSMEEAQIFFNLCAKSKSKF